MFLVHRYYLIIDLLADRWTRNADRREWSWGEGRARANLSSSDIKAGGIRRVQKYFVHESFIEERRGWSEPISGSRHKSESRDDLSIRCKGHNRCLDGRRIGYETLYRNVRLHHSLIENRPIPFAPRFNVGHFMGRD